MAAVRCSAPQMSRCMAVQDDCLEMCAAPGDRCDEDDDDCGPTGGSGGGGGGAAKTAGATVKYWSPDTPYLRAIAAAGADTAAQYAVYLQQRGDYAKTPAFYMDVGSYFLNPANINAERRAIGIRVLSNIAELGLDNSRILRVLGYKLHEAKEYELASEVFCKVALFRPTEPQSYRDLGLTLLERGWLQAALEQLWQAVTMEVDGAFSEIEVEALWEMRDCLYRASQRNVQLRLPATLQRYGEDLVAGHMPLALRVTMGWDQDNVDLDLHVIEPNGEEAYYGHKLTLTGGLMSRDFTQGYGPESYIVKRAARGTYRFKTNYFASHMPQLTGPTVAILTITTNFLRPEQRTVTTLIRLNEAKDNGEIGSVTIE